MEIVIAIYIISAIMVLLTVHRVAHTGPKFARGYKRIKWDHVRFVALMPILNTIFAFFIWIQSIEDTIKGKT